jgi:hypothetical protein
MVEDPEADRLYALPLEQFTEARDALAERLRKAGDAEEAARIRKLRKPTTPAWAVNQLTRRHRDGVENLITASEGVRRAQQELLHGGDAGDLWAATLVERDAVSGLVREAESILREAGLGAPRGMLDRVGDTLSAAASDPGGRTLLRRGSLTQEMRRAGFGETLAPVPGARRALASVPDEPARPAAKAKAKDRPSRRGAPTARELLEAEREADRLARQAERLDADAERAGREVERADHEAAQARKRAEAAEESARATRAAAASAKRAATEAHRFADRAVQRLEKLRDKG